MSQSSRPAWPHPQWLPAQLPPVLCGRWQQALHAAIDRGLAQPGNPDVSRHSSSLRLRALSGEGLDLDALVSRLWRGRLRARTQALLGERVSLLVDQCWARRQHAPGRGPAGHAAHGWHQDGALHFNFAEPDPPDALLRMITCWVALTPAGATTPGLELLTLPLPQALPPQALAPAAVAGRFPAAACWRPVMQAGDALLFTGDTLHRTHVAAGMVADRISVELRFVAAGDDPPRLRQEPRLALEPGDRAGHRGKRRAPQSAGNGAG